MPSYFSQVFTNVMVPPAVKRNLDFSYRHIPMLNEVSTSLSSYLASQGQISKKKALMRWFKGTPELVAFINKVANDMCNFYHFEPVGRDSAGSGRNRIIKVNKFALNHQFRQMRSQIAVDALVTGDGFGWMGKIPIEKVHEVVKEVLDRYTHLEIKGYPKLTHETKEQIRKEIIYESKASLEQETDDIDKPSKFYDEDVLAPRTLRCVPSTTVEVVYDRYDVKGYNHFLGVYLPMFFSPEEIIHFTLMRRDGKVNGYTSVEAVIVQLELLRQMWQNQLALHKNGGAPDKIFNMKNLQISSPAYKRIEEQVGKYRLAENKHGNMLFTGDLEVIDLQQLDEMQFKDMGLYITGLVAMQWGIPRSSIPFIVGGTNTKDDTGGNAERGYWQFIRGLQLVEAEIWNTQLFMPYFKVKLVPELSFPQLEVQEEAARQAKIQNLMNIDAMLMKNGVTITQEKKLEILGLTDDDIEDLPEEMMVPNLPSVGTPPNAMNTGTPKTSKDKPQSDQGVGKAVSKRQEQQNTIASRGKPSGYGKEKIKTVSNKPKLRKDEPVKQLSDNNKDKVGKQDSAIVTDGAGPEMPSDWNITKDNKVSEPNPEKNMVSSPEITPQLNTYPTGSITTENLSNPAGQLNNDSTVHQATGDNSYVSESEEHDNPSTKPEGVRGKYPTQRQYPDENPKFKESQTDMGMRIEEEHRDVYDFIETYLKLNKKLPSWEDVKKRIVLGHVDEISNYYTRLKKLEGNAKEMDKSAEKAYKGFVGTDDIVLDLKQFVNIYMEDSRYHPGKPPRLFMRKTPGAFTVYTLKFKSNDFVYRTQINEQDLKTARVDILLSNIRGQIYRL